MSRKAALAAIIVVGTMVLGIGIAKGTGYWRTESSKIPVKITEGEFAGENDPGDIRGSYSFGDIEAAFGVPPEILAAAFLMPGADPSAILAKDLETTWDGLEGDVEVGTDSVRVFTALWTGLPHDTPEDTTVLPLAAVDILLAYGKIDATRAAELASRAVVPPDTLSASAADVASSGETDDSESAEESEHVVKGLTTFGDLKAWGVTEDAWETAIGAPMGGRSESLREWAEAQGQSVGEVKAAAQVLADDVP